MKRINKRHIELATKLIRSTRFDRTLFQYVHNLIWWKCFNPHKNTSIPYPRGIMLELGNRCNLHCIICPREYHFGQQMHQGFMPLENAKKIVDELYPYLTSIGLTGLGETLLYPHMLDILQYIKQKKPSIITTISTNANFNGCVEKMIPLLPYLDNVQFSVDGIGAVYEKIRPSTCFDSISNNIRQITEAAHSGTTFMINTVITPENCFGLENIVTWADSIGIQYVNYNRFNLGAIPELDHQSHIQFFHGTEYKTLLHHLKELQHTHPGLTFDAESQPGKGNFQECMYLWHHNYITWDGYMVPCCIKPFPLEKNFGNVFEKGVMAVINGPEYRQWRQLWQQNIAPQFCEHCGTIEH